MSTPGSSPAQQGPMRRIGGNLGYLLRGRGIAAVMLLATTALMARALGPVEFGLVVLIHTYVVLVRGLFNVKQFLAIIRYGVPALDTDDLPTLRRLVSICLRLDRFTCIAATVAAASLAPLIGPHIGLEGKQVLMLIAYSLVLLATANRTAIGILRLFDRYDVLGNKETIGPCIRLLGVAIAWWLDSPMEVFVAVFALGFLVEEVYLGWSGRREYRCQISKPGAEETPQTARMTEFPGLRQFLWITYWQSNVDLIPKHGSIMLAGFLLGPTDAGLLRLARQFSTMLSKPAGLVRQVVFPDLTRSWNQGSTDFKLIVYRTALLAAGLGALFVTAGYFFGELLLGVLIGPEFVAAAPVLTLLLLASTFDLTASSLRSAAYAIGHAGKVLRLYAMSAVVYLTLFIVFTLKLGLIGSGIAACCAAALPPLAMALLIRKHTRGDAKQETE
ncbi:MAG: lipopolysaccharide biosynthesis protein [Marinobacter sp.]|uniref:lipopolysaccharide biosynthesis protein n=1 Tax=Marinobacter sp. TaxID=50741 RepID=UPI003297A2F3